MSKEKGGISVFQKYLTVWVILCMAAGILIGKLPTPNSRLPKPF